LKHFGHITTWSPTAICLPDPSDAALSHFEFAAVVRIETARRPLELLEACKEIEQEMGRVAGPRHGPRPIDIDLLMADDERLESGRLRLPHPEVKTRRFVLVPLLELDPPDAVALRDALQALPPAQRVERVGALIP